MADSQPAHLKRQIGLYAATAITVGNIIGSGIFRSPHSVASELTTFPLVLTAWIVGGLMRALRTDYADDRRVAAALLVLLAMQLTYYIAYGVEFVQYALAGLAMAWVAAWRQRQRAAAAVPAPPTWRSVVAWR